MTDTTTVIPSDDVQFDLSNTIFSARGSWMNLSRVIGVHDVSAFVHIVSHRTKINPIFRIVPPSERGTWVARASVLMWVDGDSTVEFAFQDIRRIRVRARNAAISLEAVLPRSGPMFSVDSYVDQHDGSIVFTVEETGQRYRVKALGGATISTRRLYEAAYASDTSTPSVSVAASADAELVIEEIEGADISAAEWPAFDDVVAARRREFSSYLDDIAPFRTPATPGITHAAYVNWATTVAPGGFIRRDALLMSKHWMDKFWSWDHCFNALALTGRPSEAWDQFMGMFDYQTAVGQIPDSIAHSEVRYNYAKPPIHGLTLKALLERLPEEPDTEQLTDAFDALSRWTTWWTSVMTAPGETLAHYYFGNDSGWDNSTMFDGIHPVQAPDLNSFLILQMETIADLAERLERHDSAAQWRSRSKALLAALIDTLWDGSGFRIRKPATGETAKTQALLFAMPIILGDRLPKEMQTSLVATIKAHLTDYGLATENPLSAAYEADGYWRGPIWAPSTYLIWLGLRASHEDDLARQISDRFRAMCNREGFAENFDALNGAGLRDRAYTWTASVYLLLAGAAAAEPASGDVNE